MGFLKRLFGYEKAEITLDTQWHDQDFQFKVSDPSALNKGSFEPSSEYVEEPVRNRVKERKIKKLNKGLTKKVAAKSKKKAAK